jgi:opacity protein-like surface antigen
MIVEVGQSIGRHSGITSMRLSIAVAAVFSAALPAMAADMAEPPPVLRGAFPAESGIDWSGFYVGGFGSYNATSLNRNRAQGSVDDLLSRLVRGSVIEPGVMAMPLIETGRYRTNTTGFGGFAGYNWTADGAVFGLEADYTRTTIRNEISGARSGRVNSAAVPATTYDWTANTFRSSRITEFGTIRGRLGYAWGNMMPFMTAGVAIGRSSENRSANIAGIQFLTAAGSCAADPGCGPTLYTPDNIAEGNRAKVQFGYALGLGFDYAFTNNIFVRAEAQHIRFPDIANTSAQINQARVGAGLKF